MPPVAQKLEDYQPGADNDGRISQVESVPVVIADVKIDEVGDAAAQDTVENVAGRAAQDHGHAALTQRAAGAAGGQQPDDESDDRDRKNDQKRSAPGRRGVREQAEGYAGIGAVYEIQEARDQDAAGAGGGPLFYGVLAHLVGCEDGYSEERKEQDAARKMIVHSDRYLRACRRGRA